MFGLIAAGRPVDASPQAFSETQFAFKIDPTPSFNHIVVFLLPGTQLPPGFAASVFCQIPPSQEGRFLGGIGPGKESAIFKVSGNAANGELTVGVVIEPAADVEAKMTQLKSNAPSSTAVVPFSSGSVTTKLLAKAIIKNAFNFLASFGSDVIPLKAFEAWWAKFEKKIELDPSFLENEAAQG
ncbi:Hypothetical protein R9X50_00763100 [Acrodontium crateriforme]|uniref:Hikeshi-like domain-containing protein n=1 Tax=Acrodontium crateriforme TaxID=150365 RepID=A0AAQ3MD23_9PEZI|nr:Hypothetical protein R9X50_00763100 [Acrodontium crateriforme]